MARRRPFILSIIEGLACTEIYLLLGEPEKRVGQSFIAGTILLSLVFVPQNYM